MRLLAGVLLGILIVILAAIGVAATGSFNVAAVSSPSRLEQTITAFTLDRSIARRASGSRNPFSSTAENLRVGLAHYKENCVSCHGAPGVPESEAGMGLNPSAPDLTLPRIQKMSDGELFWVISNGIRMTGMPAFSLTHKPDEIWKIVGFVRHLPELTDPEQKVLKEEGEEAAHHDEQSSAGARQTQDPDARHAETPNPR